MKRFSLKQKSNLARIFLLFVLAILFCVNANGIQTKRKTFSVEHGLSQSTVNSIIQDDFGQMWFGTRNGVNLFNGYYFEVFQYNPNDTNSLINNEVTVLYKLDSTNILIGTRNGISKLDILTKKCHNYNYKKLGYTEFVVNDIFQDKSGKLWVAAREGIFLFDKSVSNFIAYEQVDSGTGSANTFAQDDLGNLWLGTNNGLFLLDSQNKWRLIKEILHNTAGVDAKRITSLCIDGYNNLWAGTRSNGAFYINTKDSFKSKHYHNDLKTKNQLISNEIRDIVEDEKGRIWIGTKEGINIYDPFSNEMTKIISTESVINSISQNSVYKIYEDSNKGMWIGTWSGGVNLLKVDYQGFNSVTKFEDDGYSNTFRAVSSIAKVDDLYWIGSENNGIVIMDRYWNTIGSINVANTKGKIRSNHIKRLFVDSRKRIWIGYYDRGIQIYDPRTQKITDKIDHINIYDLKEYPNEVFWITSRRAIIKLNLNTGEELTYNFYGLKESTNQQAGATILIRDNSIWTGSRFGLDVFNQSDLGVIKHYNLTDLPNGNYSMHIFSLAEERSGRIWIGTSQGLYYFDTVKDSIFHVALQELHTYTVYGIIIVKDGLWLSTNNGIIFYNPEIEQTHRFSHANGLQSNEFIRNSFLHDTNNKRILFGGVNGFCAFNPENTLEKNQTARVLITKLQFINKSGEYEHINYPEKFVILPPGQSTISIEYNGLDYFKNEDQRYAYKLEGLSDNWVNSNNTTSAVFNNLKPGNYTLIVQSINENNELIGSSTSISFKIKRPYYANTISYLIYIFITGVIVFLIYRFLSQKRTIQNELKLEKMEHDKLTQLNELKTKFFMNVSHEFRTPLTVIHGPIERMVEENDFTLNKEEAKTMLRNSERLIGLLDQLLELRRVEKGKTKMKVEYLDLTMFTKDILQMFRTIAHEKSIKLDFTSTSNVHTWIDREKINKILSNLISNAIKFTPEQGRIIVEVSENQDPKMENLNAEINIIDNGPGIKPELLNTIFNRFESHDENNENPKGIGIGLSLANELVLKHHGKILVDSAPGEGSVFTIVLPKQKEIYENDENVEVIGKEETEQSLHEELEQDDQSKTKNTILVVDDNRDIRNYISGILKDFNILEAESVEEAESLLSSTMPELIVSDIILPGKDGYEFCRQLKSSQQTSHIPVILMTAKGSDDNRVQGLEIGADAFIPKPFSEKIMKVWVEKLIDARKKLFDYYMAQIMFDGKKGADKGKVEDSFLEKARKIIEKDISNPDLSVEMLSKHMNMSRSNLHLKFKAVLNQTPSDFIRIIRLNHSAKILMEGNHNIVEAAYSSGFNSPSYFTKCFKQYFKKTPSEFIEKKQSD